MALDIAETRQLDAIKERVPRLPDERALDMFHAELLARADEAADRDTLDGLPL